MRFVDKIKNSRLGAFICKLCGKRTYEIKQENEQRKKN